MPQSIIRGGSHTVAASLAQLADDDTGFRVLTIRLETDAAGNITFGSLDSAGDPEAWMFLKADESWTFGPNAGTIRPSDIYIVGTADDVVSWIGVIV